MEIWAYPIISARTRPSRELLQTRLPTSLRIGGQSVLLGAVVGLLLGIVAALKHNSIWDTLCTVVSVLGVSVPSYVFALFLAYTCGFQLGWFPLAVPDQPSVYFQRTAVGGVEYVYHSIHSTFYAK